MKNYTSYSDTELIKLVRSKRQSECAFRELYDRYSKDLYNFCLSLQRDKLKADDIFQETVISFYKSIKKGTFENNNIKSFLFITAKNRYLNSIRNSKRFTNLNVQYFDLMMNTTQENNELRDLIDLALVILDDKYRIVYTLREHHNFDYKEIAKIIGTSYEGAKSRYRRAKLEIISILKPYIKEYKDESL